MLKLSDNISPKGFGLNAHEQKINLIMKGTDGKIWVVKNFNGINRWVIHDYYKEFKKAELKLIKLLEKSIIKFKYLSIQEILLSNKNYFKNQIIEKIKLEDIYFPSIRIKATIDNEFDKIFASLEYKILCCKSGFYKYTIQSGHDSLINNKKITEINFYYDVSIDCKIWKDYEKECIKYNNDIIDMVKKNKEIISKLPKNKQEYIYKNYS
jgi:hypothetical protein